MDLLVLRIKALVRESIANPCLDFQKSTDINMDIHVFMGISLQLSMFLWISNWISLDFYGYPCIDLLWILHQGSRFRYLTIQYRARRIAPPVLHLWTYTIVVLE